MNILCSSRSVFTAVFPLEGDSSSSVSSLFVASTYRVFLVFYLFTGFALLLAPSISLSTLITFSALAEEKLPYTMIPMILNALWQTTNWISSGWFEELYPLDTLLWRPDLCKSFPVHTLNTMYLCLSIWQFSEDQSLKLSMTFPDVFGCNLIIWKDS